MGRTRVTSPAARSTLASPQREHASFTQPAADRNVPATTLIIPPSCRNCGVVLHSGDILAWKYDNILCVNAAFIFKTLPDAFSYFRTFSRKAELLAPPGRPMGIKATFTRWVRGLRAIQWLGVTKAHGPQPPDGLPLDSAPLDPVAGRSPGPGDPRGLKTPTGGWTALPACWPPPAQSPEPLGMEAWLPGPVLEPLLSNERNFQSWE